MPAAKQIWNESVAFVCVFSLENIDTNINFGVKFVTANQRKKYKPERMRF